MARHYRIEDLAGAALVTVPCAVCLGSDTEEVGVDNGFRVQRCRTRGCGFVYVSPRPDAERLARMYERFYDPDDAVPEKWEREMGDLFDECRAWLVAERPRGTVLDVGCSFGHFLRRMEEEGWRATGIEPSPVAAAHARKILAGRVLEETFESADLATGSFDAVVSLYVLEHVSDPRGFLEKVLRVLRPGGLAIVRIPYTAPLFPLNRLLGRPLMFAPMHLNDFPPGALLRLARDVGFRSGEVRIGARRKAHDLVENVGARVLGGLGRAVEVASRGRFMFPLAGALSYRLTR